MHDSVYDIAGDDPRMAKYLRLLLVGLAKGPNRELAELAEGVLDGSVDLRQAAASDAYDHHFDGAFTAAYDDYQSLDSGQREALEREGSAQLNALLEDTTDIRR